MRSVKKKKPSRAKQVNQQLEQQRLQQLGNCFIKELDPGFSDDEISYLRGMLDEKFEAAVIGSGKLGDAASNDIRRSEVRDIPYAENKWVYDKVWSVVKKINTLYQFDIKGINETIQLARYDESNQGFYTWHTDTSVSSMNRKISVSIPLSHPFEFEGGELEFIIDGAPRAIPQTRGKAICFPSIEQHRVTPVTKGRRYSMVVWVDGPNWR